MYRKLIASKLMAAIQMSLKRTEINKNLTANQILNDEHLIKNYLSTENAKRFLSTIRSSPEFWGVKKKEIFAMIRQLGIPTFFITLSPAEIDWIELLIILKKIQTNGEDILSKEDASKIKRSDRIELLKNDPVTTARYFENRIRNLIAYMFNPHGGTFKDYAVIDYFWRVEFQTRGSPHIHMLVWLKDSPKYNVCEYEIFEYDYQKNNKVYEFIDKYITSNMPSNGIVKNSELSSQDNVRNEEVRVSYQNHDHKANFIIDDENILGKDPFFKKKTGEDDEQEIPDSQDYRYNLQYDENEAKKDDTDYFEIDKIFYSKNNINVDDFRKFDMKCKYNFPHPIIDDTVILAPYTEEDYDKMSLKQINDRRAYFYRIKIMLNRVEEERNEIAKRNKKSPPSMRTQLTELTEIDFLKLIEINKVNYLEALRTSIDRITVFYKRTSFSIMLNNYNKDIYLKHKANMDIQFVTDAFGLATYVAAYLMKSNATISKILTIAAEEVKQGNMSIRRRLERIAEKFQNCSEISAQECVYHLLSMPVSFCSREFVFIMTFPSKERFTVLKEKSVLQELGDSTDIFQDGLIEHYVKRPAELEKICLAEFASYYDFISKIAYNQRKQKYKDFSKKPIFERFYLDNYDEDELEQVCNEEQLNFNPNDNMPSSMKDMEDEDVIDDMLRKLIIQDDGNIEN